MTHEELAAMRRSLYAAFNAEIDALTRQPKTKTPAAGFTSRQAADLKAGFVVGVRETLRALLENGALVIERKEVDDT